MEWDLQEFGWESSNDLDHELGFASSAPQRSESPSSGPNSGLVTSSNKAREAGTVSLSSPGKKVMSSCSVDGCKADLSGCRDYHRRHRVCERHSKTPIVVVKGEEKRFCQQCSRFHYLGEFDEVKRSCRKRLDGHNRRRRKLQPEPLYFSSKNFLSSFKGPRILHFGNPQLYATGNVKNPWPEETKPKLKPESLLYGTHQSPQISFNVGLRARHGPYHTNSREQILSHQFHPPERGRSEEDPMMIPMMTRQAPTDEEVSLPIDSGGRALYLLSTNLTPSFQPLGFDPVGEAPPEALPDPSFFYSGPISLE